MKIYRIYDDDRKRYVSAGGYNNRTIWQQKDAAQKALVKYVSRSKEKTYKMHSTYIRLFT